MKTVREIQEASLSDDLVTTSMGMELNAVSFNHIISNLYRNPLAAVIRELTTNALESHVAAKTDKRVAIQLPTALEQELIIRDFGTGLSHDDVQKYLNCLFSSSKAGDNDSMGGFGLGSKSALALVDTFNLTSICNGKMNTYAWINEAGKLPSLIRIGDEEDTKQPSGITVQIPLGSSTKLDIANLEEVCKNTARMELFSFTNKKVLFTDNISVDSYEDLNDITDDILLEKELLSLDNVSIFDYSNRVYPYTKQHCVMIGDVSYPMSVGLVAIAPLQGYLKGDYIIALKAPIGSLDLPMSREEVLDTKNNRTILDEIVKKAELDIQEHIKSLDINLDCSVTEYYSQMLEKLPQQDDSAKLKFNLDLSEATFAKHESVLLEPFKNARYSSLTYSKFQETYKSNDRLIVTFYDQDLLKCFVYDKSYKDREQLTSGYNYFEKLDMGSSNYSFAVTSLPLPKGIRTVDLVSYAQSLNTYDHQLVLLQVVPEAVESVERLIEIMIARQKFIYKSTFKDADSKYLGRLVAEDIKAHLATVKATAKSTNTVIRSTLDHVPGFYIDQPEDLNCYRGGIATANRKVFRLISTDGKYLPAGPAYLTDEQKKRKVILRTDVNSTVTLANYVETTLPRHVFHRDDRLPFVEDVLAQFLIITVPARSLATVTARLKADGVEVLDSSFKPIELKPLEFEALGYTLQKNILTYHLHTELAKIYNSNNDRHCTSHKEKILSLAASATQERLLVDPDNIYFNLVKDLLDDCIADRLNIFSWQSRYDKLEDTCKFDTEVLNGIFDDIPLKLLHSVVDDPEGDLLSLIRSNQISSKYVGDFLNMLIQNYKGV